MKRCVPQVKAENKSQEQAVAQCLSMFRRRKNSKLEIVTNHIRLALDRKTRYEKDEFVGYPATPITKEGVMNRGFKPKAEVEGFVKVFSQFNIVMPVTVNHPDSMYGVIVSEDDMVGTFGHNTEFNPETTQATTEIRITKKFPDVIEKIDSGEFQDVSIGYFALTERLENSEIFVDEGFSGEEKEYDFIERALFPNHLALLKSNEGACSRKDGCGFDVNINARFTPPESGDLPEQGKKILAATYSSCRQKWVDAHPSDPENAENKTRCSKIAWGAVRRAGFNKDEDGNWVFNETSQSNYYLNDMEENLMTDDKDECLPCNQGNEGADNELNESEPEPKKNFKECQKCGSVFSDGIPACPVCGNKDFIDAGVEGPLDLEGDAYVMTWVKPPTVSNPNMPAEGVIGNMTEKEVNELTQEDLKDNPHVQELNTKLEEVQKVNAELLEFKNKIEEAELNSLREQAKSIIPEDKWEEFGLNKEDITVTELKTIIKMKSNGLVPEKEENLEHLRTGGDNSQEPKKESTGARIRRKQFTNETWQELPPEKEED
jgi:cation transport regulator ChaB